MKNTKKKSKKELQKQIKKNAELFENALKSKLIKHGISEEFIKNRIIFCR